MALKIRIFIDWLTDQLIGWLVGRLIDLTAITGIKWAFYSFVLSRGRVILINDRRIIKEKGYLLIIHEHYYILMLP